MNKTLMLIVVFTSLFLVGCTDLASTENINNMKITDISGYNSREQTCIYSIRIASEYNNDLGFRFTDAVGKYNIGDIVGFMRMNPIEVTYDTVITPKAITTPVSPGVNNVINITNN